MPQLEGITTTKNIEGEITHLTIDIQKNKDLKPLLTELGLLPKTTFQKNCEDAISMEEFRKRVHKKLNDLWLKK